MTIAYEVDAGSDVGYEPPPFSYQLEASYTRQLLLQVVVIVVLAAMTVTVGLSLTTVGA